MATFEMSGDPHPVMPSSVSPGHYLITKNHGSQLDRYVELRAQKEQLEQELDAVEQSLVGAFTDHGVEKVKTTLGAFTLTKRTTKVIDDPDVKRLEEELAVAKEEAVKNNRYVTKVGASSIRFTSSL